MIKKNRKCYISRPDPLILHPQKFQFINPCCNEFYLSQLVLGIHFQGLLFQQHFEMLGFNIVREREHISMLRNNADGTKTPLTMPNHIVAANINRDNCISFN